MRSPRGPVKSVSTAVVAAVLAAVLAATPAQAARITPPGQPGGCAQSGAGPGKVSTCTFIATGSPVNVAPNAATTTAEQGNGVAGFTDTGYAVWHFDRRFVFDDRGCATEDRTGRLETRLVKVVDVQQRGAGPFGQQFVFVPGISYVAELLGNGFMATGQVSNGPPNSPTAVVPIDRTASVPPVCVDQSTRGARHITHRRHSRPSHGHTSATPTPAGIWDAPAYPSDQSASLRLLARDQIDARMIDLTFSTPYLAGPTKVRVVLPSHYDPTGRTRYPVLWLLHGASFGTPGSTYEGNAYATWSEDEHAEALTTGLPLILVCPDSGAGGGYVDWLNSGVFGPPAWEAYHLNQLLPWIDHHLPTIARRAGRAIAGLSMGGYGAIEYAARRPDLFSAAAAFSGAVDVTNPYMQAQGLGGYNSRSNAYGLYPLQLTYLHARNPTDLAENLAGLTLVQRTGNGQAGGPDGNSLDPIELDVYQQNLALNAQLDSLGIPHLFDSYGPGGHEAYYWIRDLRQTLPIFMRVFAHPPAPPVPFNYRSMDPRFAVYGWNLSLERKVAEFSAIRFADRHGFELLGSGSAAVTTARFFRPGAIMKAVVRARSGTLTELLHADRAGRVTVRLTLGPANGMDEYSPQAQAAEATYGEETTTDSFSPTTAAGSPGTVIYTARVTFEGRQRSAARNGRHARRGRH